MTTGHNIFKRYIRIINCLKKVEKPEYTANKISELTGIPGHILRPMLNELCADRFIHVSRRVNNVRLFKIGKRKHEQ